jgi:hypothetical protein
LALGDLADALYALKEIKKLKEFDPNDAIVALVEQARMKADAAPVIPLSGAIPDPKNGDGFYFTLYRRDFEFRNIVGSLDSFSMDCRQQSVESKITNTAAWHVPKNWDDCSVFVRGAPGTTFEVYETKQ